MWKNYYVAADAVVFIIDAADQSRFAESKRELDGVLADEQVKIIINVYRIQGVQ